MQAWFSTRFNPFMWMGLSHGNPTSPANPRLATGDVCSQSRAIRSGYEVLDEFDLEHGTANPPSEPNPETLTIAAGFICKSLVERIAENPELWDNPAPELQHQ